MKNLATFSPSDFHGGVYAHLEADSQVEILDFESNYTSWWSALFQLGSATFRVEEFADGRLVLHGEGSADSIARGVALLNHWKEADALEHAHAC